VLDSKKEKKKKEKKTKGRGRGAYSSSITSPWLQASARNVDSRGSSSGAQPQERALQRQRLGQRSSRIKMRSHAGWGPGALGTRSSSTHHGPQRGWGHPGGSGTATETTHQTSLPRDTGARTVPTRICNTLMYGCNSIRSKRPQNQQRIGTRIPHVAGSRTVPRRTLQLRGTETQQNTRLTQLE